MPRLDKGITLHLIDRRYGLAAAQARGVRPPDGIRCLAEDTDLPLRTLRGAVSCGEHIADYRIARIAKALKVEPNVLIAADDPPPKPEPAKPPKPQPKVEPVAPPGRRNGGGTGPRRTQSAA